MRFSIPLLLDSAGEPKGLFSVETSEGSIVILFASGQRRTEYAEVAAELAQRDGDRFGFTEVEAGSFAEAVASIRRIGVNDPAVTGATFLPDTAPFATELIAGLSRLL